jgi:hypothetical protein
VTSPTTGLHTTAASLPPLLSSCVPFKSSDGLELEPQCLSVSGTLIRPGVSGGCSSSSCMPLSGLQLPPGPSPLDNPRGGSRPLLASRSHLEEVLPPWQQPDYRITPLSPQTGRASSRPLTRRVQVTARTETPPQQQPPTGLAAWARCRSVPRDFSQPAVVPPLSPTTGRLTDRRQFNRVAFGAAADDASATARLRVGAASPLPGRQVLDLYTATATPPGGSRPISPATRYRSRTPWADVPLEPASRSQPLGSGHSFCAQRKVLA